MESIDVQGGSMPVLGLGTWEMTGTECRDAVKNALDIGYRHIDTAQAYDNEEEVGRAIQESGVPREEIFLTTKIWTSNFRYDDVIRSFNESLKKLKTDYVDLLLIHWPNDEVPLDETLKAFNDLKKQGKVKNIGVSNFTVDQLEKARRLSDGPIFTNQVEYHTFLSQDKLLSYCRENNIILTAYSPVARGLAEENAVLREIGDKYGKTPSQVALRWLLQQENVAAIPKAASKDHQEENMDIFGFELSKEDMVRIGSLEKDKRQVDPFSRTDWD